jgi:hypothetical protein
MIQVVITDFRESYDILFRRTPHEFDRTKMWTDWFSSVTPEGHALLSTLDPQFRIHRRLIQDSMNPVFLHDIAAPCIYAAAQNLVAVWTKKARLADGYPFCVRDDLYNAIFDGLWAFTFGLEMADGAHAKYRFKLEAIESLDLPREPNGLAVFPAARRPADYSAVIALADRMGRNVRSIYPWITDWFSRLQRQQHWAFRTKEAFLQHNMTIAAARLEKGISEGREVSIRCALDHIAARVREAADKKGEAPEYHSRTVYDEVCGPAFNIAFSIDLYRSLESSLLGTKQAQSR